MEKNLQNIDIKKENYMFFDICTICIRSDVPHVYVPNLCACMHMCEYMYVYGVYTYMYMVDIYMHIICIICTI